VHLQLDASDIFVCRQAQMHTCTNKQTHTCMQTLQMQSHACKSTAQYAAYFLAGSSLRPWLTYAGIALIYVCGMVPVLHKIHNCLVSGEARHRMSSFCHHCRTWLDQHPNAYVHLHGYILPILMPKNVQKKGN